MAQIPSSGAYDGGPLAAQGGGRTSSRLPFHGAASDTLIMGNEQWWSKLEPATREWLIANNGDAVPERVAAEVAAAGGPVAAAPAGEDDTLPGLFYRDEILDWVEETANTEDPQASV